MRASIDLVHQLAQPDSALCDMPLLLVVAHPDDEVLGAGSRLPHLRKVHIVYATDGSPSDMSDARRSGFATSQDYAHARVREAEAARALLDVDPDRVFRLGLRDQGVALVEVKTLDRSAGYAPYIATNAFYERNGFVQIDCIDEFPGWPPGNPAAIYVAALETTR